MVCKSNGKEWNQPDTKVIYDSKQANNTLTLALDYQVVIPDAKFTGYGYNAKGDTLLRYWYIALSPIYENHQPPTLTTTVSK